MLPLYYSHYRFTLQAAAPIVLGGFPAGVLRGAIGGALRTASCTTGAPDCARCPLTASCAYGRLFESAPLPASLHTGFADPPRPYVMHLPAPLPETVSAGTVFAFELVFIENAAASLPALVRALHRLQQTGLGDARRGGSGRFRLLSVEAVHTPTPLPVWSAESRRFAVLPGPTQLGSTACPGTSADALRVRFVTPVRLRAGGQTEEAPTPASLVRGLTRRVQALAAVHGRLDTALQARLDAWRALAPTLAPVQARFQPTTRARYSAPQRRRITFDGTLGMLTLAEGWQPFWPLLDAGRLLHVGKSATHGLGQYHLDTVQAPLHAYS